MKLTAVVLGASFAVFAGASAADTVPQRLSKDLQEDFDLSIPQSIGVAAALAGETTNFRFLQEHRPLVEGSRGGIGYAQWTASRRVAFETWAGRDADLTSYEVNYGYLKEELSGKYAWVMDLVRQADGAKSAMEVFTYEFLRPHPDHVRLSERMDYAEAYLEGDWSGAACEAVHSVRVSGRHLTLKSCEMVEVEVEVVPHLYEVLLVSEDGKRVPRHSGSWGSYLASAETGLFDHLAHTSAGFDPERPPVVMSEAPEQPRLPGTGGRVRAQTTEALLADAASPRPRPRPADLMAGVSDPAMAEMKTRPVSPRRAPVDLRQAGLTATTLREIEAAVVSAVLDDAKRSERRAGLAMDVAEIPGMF